MNNFNKYIIPVVVVVVLGGASFFIKIPKKTEQTSVSPTVSVNPSSTPAPSGISGVQWYGTPKKINADLNLLVAKPKSDPSLQVTYYELGVLGDAKIIWADVTCDGPGCSYAYFFRKEQNTSAFITDQSDSLGDNYALSSSVKVDSGSYVGLSGPDTLSYQQVPLTKVSNFGEGSFYLFTYYGQGYNLTLLDTMPEGKLYSSIPSGFAHSPVWPQQFVLQLPSGNSAVYQYKAAFMKDDGKPSISWNDGSSNTNVYTPGGGYGCGSPSFMAITNAPNAGDIEVVGTTSNGELIYQFINPNNPVTMYYYHQLADDGHGGRAYYDYPNTGNQSHPITLDEYAAAHGVLLYRDPLNRWVVFNNSKFYGGAECGKPVIYLYPTHTMPVSVKVGARITKSEPAYGNGWDVIAEPTGKQTLFWEGIGNGPYPDITQGFVVKQADLESTIRDHLAMLGLNAREAQDFMDFWWEKMPTTPYVRLTWLGTRQMDALAPLTVVPKPDTSIRIFLDFVGLEEPISISPQRLSSVPRKGFTLVEWGGLLKH